MSAWGAVPEDLDIIFPPLWTPTAKEVAEIAKRKALAIRDVFQAGFWSESPECGRVEMKVKRWFG